MKVAVASMGSVPDALVSVRFGMCFQFLVFDLDTMEYVVVRVPPHTESPEKVSLTAIRAVAQDERGAMLVGIELDRIHTLSFGLSSMLAGIAGASLLSINPAYPTMGLLPLAKSWLVVILAGLGNIRGAIIGGFIVGIVEAASYYFLGAGWQDVTSVTMLIIILLFKPSGLFGTEVKGILER